MKQSLSFTSLVLALAVLLSNGCFDKQKDPLCESIHADKILQKWKLLIAEIKDGKVCEGPKNSKPIDILGIPY